MEPDIKAGLLYEAVARRTNRKIQQLVIPGLVDPRTELVGQMFLSLTHINMIWRGDSWLLILKGSLNDTPMVSYSNGSTLVDAYAAAVHSARLGTQVWKVDKWKVNKLAENAE